MKLIIVTLAAALSLAFTSSGSAQDVCWTPDGYEMPVLIAKRAESLSLELIGSLPGPMPYPTAQKDLLDIADAFGNVGINVMHIRSMAEKANLPGPLPGPGRFAWPLPPSDVLAKQAMDLQQHTLWLLERLSNDIEGAFDHGSITPEDLTDLEGFREALHGQVADLPIPVP